MTQKLLLMLLLLFFYIARIPWAEAVKETGVG